MTHEEERNETTHNEGAQRQIDKKKDTTNKGKAMKTMNYNVVDTKAVSFERGNSPKIYKESTLYYRIKNILKNAGYDVVRQVPAKDGHMTSAPYYIRERRGKWCLFDDAHQIRSLTEPFNAGETITLTFNDLS